MKIKKLGIVAAAAIMGISVAVPATNVQASPYLDAFWGSFNGYLAGRAVNINDWDYGNLSDGNVEVKTKTGVTYVGDVVIPNTADLSYAFASSGTLQKLDVGALDTTGVDRIAQTFAMDHNLVEIDGLENWDVSKVTDMRNTFDDDPKLTSEALAGLTNWKTDSLQDLGSAFIGTGITNLDALRNWKTSNLTSLGVAFWAAYNLSDISGVENWDVSKVTNFTSTFLSDYKIQCLVNLSNWEIQDNAHTDNMFNPSWVATPLMVIVKSGAQNINRGTDVFGKDNAQHYLYKVEINGQVVETLPVKPENKTKDNGKTVKPHKPNNILKQQLNHKM